MKSATTHNQIYETHKRSIVKSITFRILVVLSDGVIDSILTGKLAETLSIVIFTNLSSVILYYLHERVWTDWKWLQTIFGRKKLRSAELKRALVKSISFRIIVIVSDLIISTFITGNPLTAAGIIFFTNVGSTIIYYLHEVVWNYIAWGKRFK